MAFNYGTAKIYGNTDVGPIKVHIPKVTHNEGLKGENKGSGPKLKVIYPVRMNPKYM